MQKSPAEGGLLSLATAPVQELPAVLVILLVMATLMLSTLSTAFWLQHAQPSLPSRASQTGTAN